MEARACPRSCSPRAAVRCVGEMGAVQGCFRTNTPSPSLHNGDKCGLLSNLHLRILARTLHPVNPAPCTLHTTPAPCTLHPAAHTLRPALQQLGCGRRCTLTWVRMKVCPRVTSSTSVASDWLCA
jgi:hypothetical protein